MSNQTIGSVLQVFCQQVLNAMPTNLGGVVSPNGTVGAKLAISADIGDHYLYFGFTPEGFLAAYFAEDMKPGRAELLWGPKRLKDFGGMTVQRVALHLTRALYQRMPALDPKNADKAFLTKLASV